MNRVLATTLVVLISHGGNSSSAAAPVNGNAAIAPSQPRYFLAAGTPVRVRLDETIDTRRNRAGDRFTATLDEPIVSGDRVIVPKGTSFSGHVREAKPSGRFKGRAVMALSLDSFALHGQTYSIRSATSRVSRGHKKHNWLWIGSGSGGGAAIGAAAAGGPGALIGAGAGAAVGTLGAAFTGKRQIDLPVETRLTFTLQSPVNLGG
jgi:hypothetical protein